MGTTAQALTIAHNCSACQLTHDVPVAEIATSARCPACKAFWRLAEPISVDEASFTAIRNSARLPIVIAFCGARSEPCRRMAPDLHEVARELTGQVIFLKVDPEQHPQLGYDFAVESRPYLVMLRDSRAVSKRADIGSEAELRRWVCAHVDLHSEPSTCQSPPVRMVSRFLQYAAVFAGVLLVRHRKHSYTCKNQQDGL
jgi:thioredoxin-like negative regulator of GroEL